MSAEQSVSTENRLLRALEHRKSITNYHASVDMVQIQGNKPSNAHHKHFEIWDNFNNYRIEVKTFTKKSDKLPSDVFLYCENCERSGWLIQSTQPDKIVEFGPLSKGSRSGPRKIFGIDIRLLGMTMYPYPNLIDVKRDGALKFRMIFENPEYPKFEFIQITNDGLEEYKSVHTKTSAILYCTLNPKFDYALTRLKFDHKDTDGKLYSFEMNASAFTKHSEIIWYPGSIRSVWSVDQKPSIEEQYSINLHSLNQPLKPEIFSVAGMNFKNGTPVLTSVKSSDNYLIWNGNIVKESSLTKEQRNALYLNVPEATPSPTNPAAVAQPFRWYYILAAVLFSGIAVYFFRRMLNRG
jgi:rRNA maturation protein Nop10